MNIWLEARLYVKEEQKYFCLRGLFNLPIVPIGTEIWWIESDFYKCVVLRYEVNFRECREDDEVVAILGTDMDIVVDEGDKPVRVIPASRKMVENLQEDNWKLIWSENADELCPEAEEIMMRAMGNWRSDPVHEAWQMVYEIEPSYREHRGLANADAGPAS